MFLSNAAVAVLPLVEWATGLSGRGFWPFDKKNYAGDNTSGQGLFQSGQICP